jgi:hypothetical protein
VKKNLKTGLQILPKRIHIYSKKLRKGRDCCAGPPIKNIMISARWLAS